jgi:hypothetical protein
MPDPTSPTLSIKKCWENQSGQAKINFHIASQSRQAINQYCQSKPFHSGFHRLLRVQAITAGSTKPTSSIPSYCGQTKTYFLLSKPFQSCQNRLPLLQAVPVRPKSTFQAIPGRPEPTSDSLTHSSQAKTDLLNSMSSRQVKIYFLPSQPFNSSQNQLPPFQAIPVRPKLTSSIPGYSRQAKTDFLHFKPFQSGQN